MERQKQGQDGEAPAADPYTVTLHGGSVWKVFTMALVGMPKESINPVFSWANTQVLSISVPYTPSCAFAFTIAVQECVHIDMSVTRTVKRFTLALPSVSEVKSTELYYKCMDHALVVCQAMKMSTKTLNISCTTVKTSINLWSTPSVGTTCLEMRCMYLVT
jgi:hypothetical protein